MKVTRDHMEKRPAHGTGIDLGGITKITIAWTVIKKDFIGL